MSRLKALGDLKVPGMASTGTEHAGSGSPYANKKCCSFTGLNVSTLDYHKSLCIFCQWKKKKKRIFLSWPKGKHTGVITALKSPPISWHQQRSAVPWHRPGGQRTRQSPWLSTTAHRCAQANRKALCWGRLSICGLTSTGVPAHSAFLYVLRVFLALKSCSPCSYW